MSKIRFRPV
jgi:hypothetical protein